VAALQAPYIGRSGSVELDAAVFGERFHEPLVHRAVRAEQAARRRGTASTLTRAEVAMVGTKAWRQKGTGRARVGALSSPQRIGGGIAFGPKPRSYTFKMNRKERRLALRSALSLHAGRGSLAAVDPSGFDTPSTKQAAAALAKLDGEGRVLLALGDGEQTTALSFRNIYRLKVLHAGQVGVADLLGAARFLASPAALDALTIAGTAPRARSAAEVAA
jgi:large subunit ribosomal protein L4